MLARRLLRSAVDLVLLYCHVVQQEIIPPCHAVRCVAPRLPANVCLLPLHLLFHLLLTPCTLKKSHHVW